MGSFEVSPRNYWAEQRLENIVHGIQPISVDLIEKYLPRVERDPPSSLPWMSELLELGPGRGKLAKDLAAAGHYRVKAIDINPATSGLNASNGGLRTLECHIGDVTKWADGFDEDAILRLERVDGVIIEALLASMLTSGGEEWKKVLDVASMWIAPSKYLFINDFWRGDRYRANVSNALGAGEAASVRNGWRRRYMENQKAFNHLGLPPTGFIVGKPGTVGKEWELGDADKLRALHRSPWFERFAQHVDPVEVSLHLRRLGFQMVEELPNFYQSRGSRRLVTPTSIQVWQKESTFRYNHVTKGLDVTDPLWEYKALSRYHELLKLARSVLPGQLAYFVLALELVALHAPPSQKEHVLRLKRNLPYSAHV